MYKTAIVVTGAAVLGIIWSTAPVIILCEAVQLLMKSDEIGDKKTLIIYGFQTIKDILQPTRILERSGRCEKNYLHLPRFQKR